MLHWASLGFDFFLGESEPFRGFIGLFAWAVFGAHVSVDGVPGEEVKMLKDLLLLFGHLLILHSLILGLIDTLLELLLS